MLNYIKRLLEPKISPKKDNYVQFGTFNILTGESRDGYIDHSGKMKYRRPKTVEVWNPPVYHCIITVTRNFSSVYRRSISQKFSLFKETNKYDSGLIRYFYTDDGIRKYIDTDAYEKSNEIVFL